MILLPPTSTRTDTLIPYATLFRFTWGSPHRQNRPPPRPHSQACSTDFRAVITTFMVRSEEHTSELQSLMRISYAVSCFKQKTSELHSPRHPHPSPVVRSTDHTSEHTMLIPTSYHTYHSHTRK